jgi:pimeloyl-ACP methyl ester carboxylesterase
VVVKTGGVEVNVHMKVAGNPDGYPLLVVPWEDYDPEYLRPYLHGVEEFCKIYYLRVPQLDDFKGLARDPKSNSVQYPTKILAQAVADVMKEAGKPKFGLLAHGPYSGVLGMTFAAEYPERVTHLVLINPRSAGTMFMNGVEAIRREGMKTGNKELVKAADRAVIMQDGNPKYKASDAAEAKGMHRAISNLLFADPTEPEAGALEYLYELPAGSSQMIDDKWTTKSIFKGKKVTFPVLIFMGDKSLWTPLSDMKAAAGTFRQAVIATIPNASETPFISDTYTFTKHLEKFFQGAKAPEKAKEEAGEKKEKGKTTVAK